MMGKNVMQLKLELELEFENRHNREVQRVSERFNTHTSIHNRFHHFLQHISSSLLVFAFTLSLMIVLVAWTKQARRRMRWKRGREKKRQTP